MLAVLSGISTDQAFVVPLEGSTAGGTNLPDEVVNTRLYVCSILGVPFGR